MTIDGELNADICRSVALALSEDIGAGDVSASLIPESDSFQATVITRQDMTLAGRPWVDEVFRQIDHRVAIDWQHVDGDTVVAGSSICSLRGPARALLTGERTALNFLQTLSATATATASYRDAVMGTRCRILDTRKTVPGLRLAQKYAVRCGGGNNHRFGLFDAILLKENHVLSAGGITNALQLAKESHPALPTEIEVESIQEMREALAAGARKILLDNFSIEQLGQAVKINLEVGSPPALLEASGNITLQDIATVAATGVDFISIGALTKNIAAVDLSMRFSQ